MIMMAGGVLAAWIAANAVTLSHGRQGALPADTSGAAAAQPGPAGAAAPRPGAGGSGGAEGARGRIVPRAIDPAAVRASRPQLRLSR
jgi:hypothetical protein